MSLRLIRTLALKYHLRSSSSVVNVVAQLDDKIKTQVDSEELNPRHHPGALRKKCYVLPDKLKEAYVKVIGDVPKKQLLREAAELAPYLHSRLVPAEEGELKQKQDEITHEVINSMKVDWDSLNEDEEERYTQILKDKVLHRMKQKCYNWTPLPFNRHLGLQYLTLRLAPEFAAVHQILSELTKTENYVPRNLFDFGSGIGLVKTLLKMTHFNRPAANDLWGDSIKEYFCVDTSADMNELSREIAEVVLSEETVRKIFHRQFLPSSSDRKYDVVVSAYSLIELSSGVARLETVLNLWNKTKDYLILVERGTMAGFKLITQAKDFIIGKEAENHRDHVYVHSPCPHESKCPRLKENRTPCNFPVRYTPYPQKTTIKCDIYSYVVLAKRQRPRHSCPTWPRIVRPVLVRSRHAFCRLCTSEGELQEVVFTPNKHGKMTHRLARMSKWGDLLPVTLQPSEPIGFDEDPKEAEETIKTRE